MKKKVTLSLMFILLLIITACSVPSENVKAENEVPYMVYEHKDSDGCDYLVVYSREWSGNGLGIGLGITQKANQPEGCR